MVDLTQETRLAASRELLLGIVRQQTSLPAEQEASIQEAVEHIDQARTLLEAGTERHD